MPPRSQREFTVGKFGDNAIPFCRPDVVPSPASPHVLCFNTFPGRTLPEQRETCKTDRRLLLRTHPPPRPPGGQNQLISGTLAQGGQSCPQAAVANGRRCGPGRADLLRIPGCSARSRGLRVCGPSCGTRNPRRGFGPEEGNAERPALSRGWISPQASLFPKM